MKNIASIKAENGDRIYIHVAEDADGFYIADEGGNDSSQYRFKSEEEALKSIDAMWGGEAWDLQYE